jgi:S-adenosylmethionine:tRNA ribosyltransferase-isomerase
MDLDEFAYRLPEALIAQEPSPERDQSRMMIVRRNEGDIRTGHFLTLPDYLRKGDVLVVNDSKVIPARLYGRKDTGAVIEILLLARRDFHDDAVWEVLLKPAKRVRAGTTICFGPDARAQIIDRLGEKKWLLRFEMGLPIEPLLQKYGIMPLPPYIRRDKTKSTDTNDRERYQTLYARIPGSVAAPTAGLHFSAALLGRLKDQGIPIASITLHVGYGTFMPITVQSVENHVMDGEYYEVTPEAADMINGARRVIAVGTTSTRVIESAAGRNGQIRPGSGQTSLFIYPGYRFRRLGALLTNFHLPRSSLLLLVCAFAGTELTLSAYRQAVEEHFRFYSYGDCMLIV